MRLTLRTLLIMLAVVALEPAATAVAAKTSITVTTDRGRECLVYVQGYIESGYFKTNGVTSCSADPVYGRAMDRLSVQLDTDGSFLLGTEIGTWQAMCQWVNYCEAWGQRSGTVPGMTYTVRGDLTLYAADYPWESPERWVSWPSQCRVASGNTLVCRLSASATRPLPLETPVPVR